MDDRFVESQPPRPNNQRSSDDHQSGYGYGGYYSPFPPPDHHQHSQKQQHEELHRENRHNYGADRPYQSKPLGQNRNSPFQNDESPIDEASHDDYGEYRYQHNAGQAEAFMYHGDKGSQDSAYNYASFQQAPGEDAKNEDAILPVENNIRNDGNGCDHASFQQVQGEYDARKQGFSLDECREEVVLAVENNISTYDYASSQQKQGEDGASHQDDSRKEGFSQDLASGGLYPPYANKQAGARNDGAYHQDDVRRQGFSQDDPAFCPLPYESREDAIPAVENNISTYDYASFQQKEGEDGAYLQDDSRKEGFSQDHASRGLYPPYANNQAGAQNDGAYHQDDGRRQGFSQDDASGGLYPPYANQQAAAQAVDNDIRDARGEREGIGGWISEVQQQETLTAKEERQGIGGWISDNHDTAVVEQEKHYERVGSSFNGAGSRDENENKEDFFTPLRPATSGVREDDRTEGSSYTDNQATGSQGEASTGRRRRSRWEPQADGEGETQDSAESAIKKRRSRWSEEPKVAFQLPDFVKQLTGGVDLDPELQSLNIKLLEISRKLQTGQVLELDDIPEAARSPSPEPIYDNNGVRINTREYRAREKLTRERQEIIAEIIKRNPAFKPPADYRPPKLYKKLFIPVKDYPGYNFIGLIIGPRGNTQKRMERETGAKIVIRGKGSIKEGRLQQKWDMKPDPFENEDLHVLVAAETQASLDAAAGMIEKLLMPVDEVRNEHKRAQLKELAALNGTIRDEEFCRICGEQGHRQYECSSRNSTFKSDVLCRICGDGGHPTIDCPLKGSTQGNKMDDEYRNFLAELGGGMDANNKGDVGRQTGPMLALPGPQGSKTPASGGTGGLWSGAMGGEMAGGNFGSQPSSGANGSYQGQGTTGVDASNLYVGYLPSTIDDEGLSRMFSPFGKIDYAKVIKEHNTGISKGYGFVKYSDPACASQAVQHLNGYRLESKLLAVRVAGKPPPAANPFNNPAGTDALGGGGQWVPPLPPALSSGAFMVNPMGAPPPWSAPPPYTSYGPPPVPVNTFGAQPMQSGPPSASSAVPFGVPFAGTPPQGAAPPSAPFQGPPVGPLQGPPGMIPPAGSHSTSPAPPFGAPFSATPSQGGMLPSAPFQVSSVGPPQGPPGVISGVPQGHSMAGFAPSGVPGLSTYSSFSQVPGYYSVPPPASANMAPPSQLPAVSGCPGSEARGTNIAHVPQGQQVAGGPSGALPPWATNTNTGVSYLNPQLQQSDAVESEYEKFMSEMAG